MLRLASQLLPKRSLVSATATSRWLSSTSDPSAVAAAEEQHDAEQQRDNGIYMHHGTRPRFRTGQKFKSPQKKASKLLHELNQEAVAESKAQRPHLWENRFRVGDALEIEMISEGGMQSKSIDKIRGVVLGIYNNNMDTTVLLRDVVFGEPIERRVPLHSPLIRNLKILEENFVFKGKKRVKRAKLYYLSDRNPLLTRVTKY